MNKKYSLLELLKKAPRDWPKVVRTKWRFWPTEASCVDLKGKIKGKCLRNCTYQWLGYDVTNPVNDFVKQCGNIGNYLEDKLIRECKAKGILPHDLNKRSVRKQQIIMFEDAQLSGEIDILIGGGTQNAGVEVKSYVNSTYKVQAGPKDPHLLQSFLYLCLFQPKQPYFIIAYKPSPLSKWATEDVYHRIDSVVLEGKTHPVINGKICRDISLEGVIERYKELKKYVEAGVLPKREFSKTSKNCEYCPYHDRCWNDPEGKTI
jgi:CRISPR/Cas system-associated exonuclease Cas4 (RecB family)